MRVVRRNSAIRSRVRRHRFATALLATIAFVLLLRLAWGWHAGRQVAAELEKVRQAGQPTTLNDLAIEPVPDGENAWPIHAQALAALKFGVDSPRGSALEYPSYPPHGPKWEALAAASEKGNAKAFPIARRARTFTRTQFPPQPKSRMYGYPAELSRMRELANTVADGAQYAHLRGDDAEAVERLMDVLHLARSARQDPALVSQLVGIGIDALALDAAQQIVPTLRLDPSDGGTPASPEQARALIAALLDERETRDWFVRSLQRERVVMIEVLDDLAKGTWAIRPLADRTAVRWLRDFDALVRAAESGNAGEARRILKRVDSREGREVTFAALFGGRGGMQHDRTVPRYSRWFEQFGPDGIPRAIEQFHRASGERRANAVIVAARLYRQDHGRWLPDAASLVPKYLDALPADPFREDGKPLEYVLLRGALPDGSDRPLVYYEAGEVDEGPDDEPMVGWQIERKRRPGTPRREMRQYRDVSLWVPNTRRFDVYQKEMEALQKSAAEAVDEDPNEPNAPGDDGGEDGAADGPPEQ